MQRLQPRYCKGTHIAVQVNILVRSKPAKWHEMQVEAPQPQVEVPFCGAWLALPSKNAPQYHSQDSKIGVVKLQLLSQDLMFHQKWTNRIFSVNIHCVLSWHLLRITLPALSVKQKLVKVSRIQFQFSTLY